MSASDAGDETNWPQLKELGSLWDMLEINAKAFMDAVMEIRRLQAVIDGFSEEQRKIVMSETTRAIVLDRLRELLPPLRELYARLSIIAAERLLERVEKDPQFKSTHLGEGMADLESRLRDELGLVKLFVLNDMQSRHFLNGADLMGQQVADRLPSVIFEMEESAKCLALGRSTASAFHSIRALEVAIAAIAAFLQIPNPTKPVEKNWGIVLGKIKDALDDKYPSKTRMPGTDGAILESLYASLDAIKNPWRNATMHTENTYQPHEAGHILQCVNVLLVQLSGFCDENGVKV